MRPNCLSLPFPSSDRTRIDTCVPTCVPTRVPTCVPTATSIRMYLPTSWTPTTLASLNRRCDVARDKAHVPLRPSLCLAVPATVGTVRDQHQAPTLRLLDCSTLPPLDRPLDDSIPRFRDSSLLHAATAAASQPPPPPQPTGEPTATSTPSQRNNPGTAHPPAPTTTDLHRPPPLTPAAHSRPPTHARPAQHRPPPPPQTPTPKAASLVLYARVILSSPPRSLPPPPTSPSPNHPRRLHYAIPSEVPPQQPPHHHLVLPPSLSTLQTLNLPASPPRKRGRCFHFQPLPSSTLAASHARPTNPLSLVSVSVGLTATVSRLLTALACCIPPPGPF